MKYEDIKNAIVSGGYKRGERVFERDCLSYAREEHGLVNEHALLAAFEWVKGRTLRGSLLTRLKAFDGLLVVCKAYEQHGCWRPEE